MVPFKKQTHLPLNQLFFGSTTVIFIVLITEIYASRQNNFQSNHRTPQAEMKVKELTCYTCDMMLHGEACMNVTRTQPEVNRTLIQKCPSNETMCSVKRFSYTIADKNSTSEKRLWSLQRSCTGSCTNSCIIIGERVKIHACETCCDTDNCNTGSRGSRTVKAMKFLSSIFFISITYAFS